MAETTGNLGIYRQFEVVRGDGRMSRDSGSLHEWRRPPSNCDGTGKASCSTSGAQAVLGSSDRQAVAKLLPAIAPLGPVHHSRRLVHFIFRGIRDIPICSFNFYSTSKFVVNYMPPKNAGKRGVSAVGDQWGLLGLQPIVNPDANTDPNYLLLTRGFDLNSLGLNLSSNDPIHITFATPWSDAPSRVQPDFKIPSCYFVTPPHLRFVMFQKFQLETLFYVFYSMPKDVLQLAAAEELHNREWKFHKELRMWITRQPNTEPTVKTAQFERGTFLVFNPDKWTKEKREDFVCVFDQLEERGAPQSKSHQPPAAVPAQAQPHP